MTGGKDSLVAWHLARSKGLHPVLLYVADGMQEYENNWRLNEIVSTIGTDIHIGKYGTVDFEFQCMTFAMFLFFKNVL
jgi:tRNA(Ile)-lysidine synthase TilS/MesJ